MVGVDQLEVANGAEAEVLKKEAEVAAGRARLACRSRQRGQVPAGRPRIPPYSVWHVSHWNMGFAYPFGGRLELL